MKRSVVIGCGGHARVLLSLLSEQLDYSIEGIIDTAAPRAGEVIMGIPVIGSVSDLPQLKDAGISNLFLALGDNESRRTWFEQTAAMGFLHPNLISGQAMVDPTASLGCANVICARAFIGPLAAIGNNNLINTASIVEHEAIVGNHSHLAPSSVVCGRTKIGDEVFLGANATVIDRISVASNVVIGAGATVVKPIDKQGIYTGTPARFLR